MLSVVVPVRDEGPNIAPLCDELATLDATFEVLFVDDGSTDHTWDAIRQARQRHPWVRGLRLDQATGKSAAYAAGFRAAQGELVATLDGDLQDDPRDLLTLTECVRDGSDLAVGWKRSGKSSGTTFLASRLANLLLRVVTPLRLHDMNCPVRVMRREVALSLDLRADHHRYIPLLAHAKGYTVSEREVSNRPRQHGESKYGGGKYLRSATTLLGVGLYLRFGQRPMALFGGLGLTALMVGFLICLTVVCGWAFFGTDIDDDIPTLILGAVFLLTGMQFVGLGLLGEIVVRRVRLAAHRSDVPVAEEL